MNSISTYNSSRIYTELYLITVVLIITFGFMIIRNMLLQETITKHINQLHVNMTRIICQNNKILNKTDSLYKFQSAINDLLVKHRSEVDSKFQQYDTVHVKMKAVIDEDRSDTTYALNNTNQNFATLVSIVTLNKTETNDKIKDVKQRLMAMESLGSLNKCESDDQIIAIQTFMKTELQLKIDEIQLRLNTLSKPDVTSPVGFTVVPSLLTTSGFYNINCDTLIFGNKPGTSHVSLSSGDGSIVLNDIENYIIREDNVLTEIVRKFIEQFKEIKTLRFDNILYLKPSSYDCHGNEGIHNAIVHLFHLIVRINPTIKLVFIGDNLWSDISPPTIISEFTKSTNYTAFSIQIKNNMIKDAITSNMRYVSSPLSYDIQKHCIANNIEFTSNIGL